MPAQIICKMDGYDPSLAKVRKAQSMLKGGQALRLLVRARGSERNRQACTPEVDAYRLAMVGYGLRNSAVYDCLCRSMSEEIQVQKIARLAT
jgi:hypothetical protein